MIEIGTVLWCGSVQWVFFMQQSLTGREKFVLASIMTQISFSISFTPSPGKTSKGGWRGGEATYSRNIMTENGFALLFISGKMVIFPFPPLLKDPNLLPPSPSRLGWSFCGKRSRGSIFSLWGSGDRLWNENVSPLRKQLMCEMKWVGPTAFHTARGIKFPKEPVSLRELVRRNLVTSQSPARPLLFANRSPVANRALQLVTCA